MPQTVFDLAMAASERPQTQALDHAATRIGVFGINEDKYFTFWYVNNYLIILWFFWVCIILGNLGAARYISYESAISRTFFEPQKEF